MKSFKTYNNSKNFQAFLLEKDHRKVMINKIKLSKDIAEELHKTDDKYSIAYANMLINQYKKDTKQKSYTDDDITNYYKKNRAKILSNIRNINDWLKGRNNNPNPKESNVNIKNISFDDALKYSQKWHDYLKSFGYKVSANPDVAKEQADALINYKDGWYWIDLKSSRCDKESQMMGHCGRTNANTLISLRDYKGIPHLTMAYNYNPSEYTQLKGKGNKKPEAKYHDKIIDIFDKLKIGKYEPEYSGADDFHVNDLPDNKKNILLKKYPDLKTSLEIIIDILEGNEKKKKLEDYDDIFDGRYDKIDGNDVYIDVTEDLFNSNDLNIVKPYIFDENMMRDVDYDSTGFLSDEEIYKRILENMNNELKLNINKSFKGIFDDPDFDYKDYNLAIEQYPDLDELISLYRRSSDNAYSVEISDNVWKDFKNALKEIGTDYNSEEHTLKIDSELVLEQVKYSLENGDDWIDMDMLIEDIGKLKLHTDYDRWYPYVEDNEIIKYMNEDWDI
jgi:hypothetical protein